MPSVDKTQVRELSLTSSFVAGGYAYHYDTNSLVTHFRFEGYPELVEGVYEQTPVFELNGARKTGGNTDVIFDSSRTLSQTQNVLSGSPAIPDDEPVYTSDTAFEYKALYSGLPLSTSGSSQVRSLRFGGENTRATAEGHIHIGDASFTEVVTSGSRDDGLTISTWVKPEATYYSDPDNFGVNGFFLNPILQSGIASDSSIADIAFGYITSDQDKYHFKPYLSRVVSSSLEPGGSFVGTNTWVGGSLNLNERQWNHLSVVINAQSGTAEPNVDYLYHATFYINGNRLRNSTYNDAGRITLSSEGTTSGYFSAEHPLVSRIGGLAYENAQSLFEGGATAPSNDPAVADDFENNTQEGILDIGSINNNIAFDINDAVFTAFWGPDALFAHLDDFAVWNRPLSAEEIRAVYYASRGAYDPKSGFISFDPRVEIRERDNAPGTYPSYTLPAYADVEPYDDRLTIEAPRVRAVAQIGFTRRPRQEYEIELEDAEGTVRTFKFYRRRYPDTSPAGTVAVDITRALSNTWADNLRTEEVKAFAGAVNASDLKITARYIDNIIYLEQQLPGASGNTGIAYTDNAASTTTREQWGLTLGTSLSFTGGSEGTTRYPHRVDSSNLLTLARAQATPYAASSLEVPNNNDPGILDAPLNQHGSNDYEPYNEAHAEQTLGIPGGSPLYGTQVEQDDPFITGGLTASPFDEPLSAMDKIVIDLEPVEETILSQSSDGYNYPMAYYNFGERKWERLGNGEIPQGGDALEEVLDKTYIGFSQSYKNITSAGVQVNIFDDQLQESYTGTKKVFQETGWNTPIDTFGFPLHPKYHAAGSQLYDAAQQIDRPFVVEKITLEYSGSYKGSLLYPGFDSSEYVGGSSTFFILNQRKANPQPAHEASYAKVYVSEDTTAEYPTYASTGFKEVVYDIGEIPRQYNGTYVDTIRDLVTFSRVGTVSNEYTDWINDNIEPGFPHPASFMDLAIEVQAPSVGSEISGRYILSDNVKAPSSNPGVANTLLGIETTENYESIYSSRQTSTRNALDVATGRALENEFLGPEFSYAVQGYELDELVYAPKKDADPSPYVIMPGDQLVLGWQSATTYNLTLPSHEFAISPGAGKLTLYGHYVKDNKPQRSTYLDTLNTDAVHETIPPDPEEGDRFETEPAMLFTGSYLESFITGSVIVSDPGDEDTDTIFARRIVHRVTEGDQAQRWSLLRGVRLVDESEQYYDSMQPDPYGILMAGKDGISSAGVIMIGYPGSSEHYTWGIDDILDVGVGTYPTFPANASNFVNNKFLSSFPFEEMYNGINRIKEITSKDIIGKFAKSYDDLNDGTLVNDSSEIAGIHYWPLSSGFKTVKLDLTGIANFEDSYNPDEVFETDYPLTPLGAKFALRAQTSGDDLKPLLDFKGLGYRILTNDNDTNLIQGPPGILGIGRGSTITNPKADINGTNYHLSRFMGCFGDGVYAMVQFVDILSIDFQIGKGSTLTDVSQAIYYSNMRYRGTKYGLVNPTPLYSNAVFLYRRFGQFRDMLEQRQYTRFYNEPTNGGNDETSGLLDPAVSVTFIDRQTGRIVSGSMTNSSNISPFCTSSLPYFEGAPIINVDISDSTIAQLADIDDVELANLANDIQTSIPNIS